MKIGLIINGVHGPTLFITKSHEKKMAGVAGLEPVTSAVTGQRSNQLSYTPAKGGRDIRKKLPRRQVLLGKFSPWFLRRIDVKCEKSEIC